jgi:hypothetical protein
VARRPLFQSYQQLEELPSEAQGQVLEAEQRPDEEVLPEVVHPPREGARPPPLSGQVAEEEQLEELPEHAKYPVSLEVRWVRSVRMRPRQEGQRSGRERRTTVLQDQQRVRRCWTG